MISQFIKSEAPIKILLVEDNRGDAIITQSLLMRDLYGPSAALQLNAHQLIEMHVCDTLQSGLQSLREAPSDVVLLDLSLPDSIHLDGLHAIVDEFELIPVIVLTGLEDEATAIQAVQEGAEDFLINGKVDSLLLRRSIAYAIERNRTRRELLKAREEARQAAQAKSEFLARMSHEIRTPLAPIVSYAELLLAKRLQSNDQEKAISTILTSGLHLQRLIDSILDFSKLEANKFEVMPEPCSVTGIFDEVHALLHPKAAAKEISFDIEYVSDIPVQIMSDPTRLKQILLNLAGNAIKFTDNGGVTISVWCEVESQELHVEVADSGIGIPAHQTEKLFAPFSQVDGSITRDFGGTGLGLYIARALCEKLGGSLSVVSAVGQGSVFTATVGTGPLSGIRMINPKAVTPRVFQPYVLAEPPKLTGTVLLAEDGVDNREVVSFLLKDTGLELVMAENGQEALDRALTKDFSLILMDLHMPIIDGISATKLLRSRGCKTPIIVLTADRSKESVDVCKKAGCTDFISKPYRSDQLYTVLKNYLGTEK